MLKIFAILMLVQICHAQTTSWKLHIIDGEGSGADGVRLADINGDSLLDVVTGWEESGVTKIYLNPGPNKVKEAWPVTAIGKTKSVEDAFFHDVDGDGNLDVITSCEGKNKVMFVHWNPGKDQLMNGKAWNQKEIPASRNLTLWMYSQAMDINGDNIPDLVAGGKSKNAQIGWFEVPKDRRNVEKYKYHKISDAGWIMSIEKIDMNKDGHTDLLISDRYGNNSGIRWLQNPGTGADVEKEWKSHTIFKFPGKEKRQYLFLTTADFDKDGQFEIIFPSKKGIHILKKEDDQKMWKEFFISTSGVKCGGPKAVAVCDIDLDNKPEIILTCEHSEKKNGVVYFKYDSNPLSENWKWYPLSGTEKGIKYDRIEMLDLDGDGDLDLMTCEENEGPKSQGLGVIWYENPAK